ncbi:MAG: FAD-dependent monooxygenase [Crocinitomicaceae bacterium]|nr:FAD-dependent monooxygenase [Crocinitomicaceae bacterium]
MRQQKIAIVGAGLVGSLWAVYLAKRGHLVQIFDRRPDIRKMKVVQGKSINLALSDRGWKGLAGAGVSEEIKKMAIPMSGRLMHSVKGELSYQPYGKMGQAIFSVSRGLLNQKLIEIAASNEKVELFFSHRCEDINLDSNEIRFVREEDRVNVHFTFDRIFGTDGAFSAVRSRLIKIDRFNYSQEYLSHGYKELEIPANSDGSHRMRNDCLHIWPRGEFMMIALPNLDGSFTCTLFIAFEGEVSFEHLQDEAKVKKFFHENFPDAYELMPELTGDFFANPNASLVMTKCYPWHYKDQIALLGDAAHAIVPFYGQGMNCGFEDCTIFDDLLNQNDEDWSAAFSDFSHLRKPSGDAILELALRNYIEMRDKTSDQHFLLQKKIEGYFSSKHPDRWTPLYSQVTFSDIPYEQALKEGDRQEKIMAKIMAIPGIEHSWNSDEIEQLILSELNKNV